MAKRVTVKDLARIAGVDHSTVSRALNNSPRVQPSTRERIKKLARQHNFQFNSNARSLSRRKTGVIGIIFPAGMEDFNSSLYTNRLFIEIRKKLESYQLDGILLEAYHPDSGESNIERLIRQNKIDGFLIIHGDIRSGDYALIRKWELPLVQVHLSPNNSNLDNLDFIFTDNKKGGELAAEHLAEKGCVRFFNISFSCTQNDKTGKSHHERIDRSEGFHRSLDSLKIPHDQRKDIVLDGSFLCGRNLVKNDCNNFKKGDGLFFHSDLMAFGALSAFMEIGDVVPSDVKLIGFDDSPISTLMEKKLSTIRQPKEEMAEQAAKRIHDLVEGPGKSDNKITTLVQELLEPVLVIRDTT